MIAALLPDAIDAIVAICIAPPLFASLLTRISTLRAVPFLSVSRPLHARGSNLTYVSSSRRCSR